ncbi:MAG TPA: DUF4440 domain-containing protein [Bacteroidales bacterium]|nr:DUF4440 domain-containing protein [Bacteroidales bacterium]
MKNKIQFLLPVYLLFFSCSVNISKDPTEIWKNEILEAEQNFAAMAGEKGIRKAFLTYAADSAVLMRNNTLVVGKNNITEYFKNQTAENNTESLTWKPEFVDVAASGDLGYTYGYYTYSYIDSTGARIENTGVFHTVWKKQADGKWRFVWD